MRWASGCEATEPVAWLEKRRCVITRGKKASCSLTTLGMLMESSVKKDTFLISMCWKGEKWKLKVPLTLFIILVGAAESVLRRLA